MPRRAGRAPLTRDRILATALKLVDQQGIEALSMRRLAAELSVDPMAIYHHVPGKPALIEGLVQLVFGEFPRLLHAPEAERASWQSCVRDWAHAYRDLARAHPNLVLHLVSNPAAATLARLNAEEDLYAALEDAGLPPERVAGVASLLVDYLNGVALAESTGLTGPPDEDSTVLAQLEERPTGDLPAMRRVYEALAGGGTELDYFEFCLDVLIAGVQAVAATAGDPAVNRHA